MRSILFTALCAVFLISCASNRAGIVDPAITEAKVLQTLAKTNGLVSIDTDRLIVKAGEQREAGQTEAAFLLADEAILQLQISLLEMENKNMTDSLRVVTESLIVYRKALEERRKAR